MVFDHDFIALLRKHDAASFEHLYQETSDQFYRYCKTYYFLDDAQIDDLIGEFYVKLRSVLPNLNPDYNLNAYLRTMFKNWCKDYFKKRKEVYGTDDQIQIRSGDPEDDSDPDQLDLMEQHFQYDQIKQSLTQLDYVSQQIIQLKYIEHQDYAQISQITGLTQANVRQKCSRVLRQLQWLLG